MVKEPSKVLFINATVPYGLVARILGFHPRGSGSIPGMGRYLYFTHEKPMQVAVRKIWWYTHKTINLK